MAEQQSIGLAYVTRKSIAINIWQRRFLILVREQALAGHELRGARENLSGIKMACAFSVCWAIFNGWCVMVAHLQWIIWSNRTKSEGDAWPLRENSRRFRKKFRTRIKFPREMTKYLVIYRRRSFTRGTPADPRRPRNKRATLPATMSAVHTRKLLAPRLIFVRPRNLMVVVAPKVSKHRNLCSVLLKF